MVVRDIAHQRQTQSHAAVSFLGPGRPIKGLEDALELRFGNAWATVANQDPQRAILLQLDPTLYSRTRRISARILEQVAHHPTQQTRIAADRSRLTAHLCAGARRL